MKSLKVITELSVKHMRFNKLTSVFYVSILLLMINCVITLSGSVVDS